MLTLINLALLPTEKDRFRAKNNSFALLFVYLFRSGSPSRKSELVLSAYMLYKHNKTNRF